jgi:hypothetical protein
LFFIVKEGYYNDELIDKLKTPPYSTLYSFSGTSAKERTIFLNVKGDSYNMNILDHYLKFEKKEFVEQIIPFEIGGILFTPITYTKGQILHNGKPLSNHIVYVNHNDDYWWESITDENGNYIFMDIWGTDCTISFKIGNNKYDIAFIKSNIGDTIIDFNVTSTWKEYEVKGQILQNGEPLIYRTVTLTAQFDFVCSGITDENGNYTFPYMREDYDYTLSFEIGDTKYDTTFVLDGDKTLDFNIDAVLVNINEPEEIPTIYSLSQNYPNPFNPTTKIQYSLPEASYVRLSVYNGMGQEVMQLVNENQSAGKYIIDFNAQNLPSGIYFYRLQTSKFVDTKKMLLLK